MNIERMRYHVPRPEIYEIHTTVQLEDYMINIVLDTINARRSRSGEFKYIKGLYQRFCKENGLFCEDEFVKAYYRACEYVCNKLEEE